MKRGIATLLAVLAGQVAWAESGPLFAGTPDLDGSILQQLDRPSGIGTVEKGRGDYYGTVLEQWGGAVKVGKAGAEPGSTDLYGSVLYDVDPSLPF